MSSRVKLPKWAELVVLPVLNLSVALVLSGLVIKLVGENPWQAMRLILDGAFGTQENIGYTFYYATNFIFTGLGVAVAFHAGLFNIGCEGQAYVGGLGAGLVCLLLDNRLPGFLVVPLSVIAAGLFGGAWAFVPAYLQAKRGSHIVITTIMFNFIASALMTYLLVERLIKPGQQSPESREFAPSAWLPAIHEWLAKIGVTFSSSPWNLAFVLALMASAFIWVFLWRTKWGYELRVTGQSPDAAVYAGISPTKITILSMVMSGALAGGVGINEIMGVQHRLILDFPEGAGFVGIAVSLMGRNHPFGIFLAAVLFGALYQGGSQLSMDMPKINRDMVVVIQGLVILLCGALENIFHQPLGRLFRLSQRRPRVS